LAHAKPRAAAPFVAFCVFRRFDLMRLDRYAARCFGFIPAVIRMAVQCAQSAQKDTGDQPTKLRVFCRQGTWLVAVAVAAASVLHAVDVAAQAAPVPSTVAPQAPGTIAPQQPAAQTPPQPGAQAPAPPGTQPATPTAGAPPTAQTPIASRAFTAPVGLLFNTVRPERVADFEQVIARVQAALEKSTDARVQEQAKGWRMFKATEPGPNGTVLYVFVMDPTVPGADYGLGGILSEAYPDVAELQEIWRLYTSSVSSGGSLLNLTPLKPTIVPLDQRRPATTNPAPQPAPSQTPTVPPPTVDTNPNVPGK
jgi:hypothetical protein